MIIELNYQSKENQGAKVASELKYSTNKGYIPIKMIRNSFQDFKSLFKNYVFLEKLSFTTSFLRVQQPPNPHVLLKDLQKAHCKPSIHVLSSSEAYVAFQLLSEKFPTSIDGTRIFPLPFPNTSHPNTINYKGKRWTITVQI